MNSNIMLRQAKIKEYSDPKEPPKVEKNSNGNWSVMYGKTKITLQPFDVTPSSMHKLIADIEGTEIIVQDECMNTQEVLVQTQGKHTIHEMRVNDKLSICRLVDAFKNLFNIGDLTKVRMSVFK
tara:strand:+ start:128 stop:499 length:372 start_codon:yes stop_codon:yes gene_type:complete